MRTGVGGQRHFADLDRATVGYLPGCFGMVGRIAGPHRQVFLQGGADIPDFVIHMTILKLNFREVILFCFIENILAK